MNAHSKSHTSIHYQPTTHYQALPILTKSIGQNASKLSTQWNHVVDCKYKISPYI